MSSAWCARASSPHVGDLMGDRDLAVEQDPRYRKHSDGVAGTRSPALPLAGRGLLTAQRRRELPASLPPSPLDRIVVAEKAVQERRVRLEAETARLAPDGWSVR